MYVEFCRTTVFAKLFAKASTCLTGVSSESAIADTTSESSGQSSRPKNWASAWKSGGISWLVGRRGTGKIDRKTLADEISGSVGDLGTFIPVVIALSMVNGMDLGTTLFFSGFFNIVTGILFGLPMPVQPMRSIAAAAIDPTKPFSIPEMMAAGLSVSFVLVFLAISGLMGFVNWLVPMSVVRGIQMAQGMSFGITAVKYILNEQQFTRGNMGLPRPWMGLDGRILAVAAFCFVVGVTGVGGEAVPGSDGDNKGKPGVDDLEGGPGGELAASAPAAPDDQAGNAVGDQKKKQQWGKRSLESYFKGSGDEDGDAAQGGRKVFVIPTALLLLVLGVLLAFIRSPSIFHSLRVGPSKPRVVSIHLHDWKTGFMRGAIPQLPISVLDSVVATVKLAHDLFPHTSTYTKRPGLRRHMSVFRVAASIGIMNIVGCWFGAMPIGHGCSGLAGQYRFGARSGLSVVLLGLFKLLLSLFLGSSLLKVLSHFPVALLGVLLLFAGLELALAGRDQNSRTDAFIMLVVAIVSVAWANAGYGFAAGMTVAWILKVRELDLEAFQGASRGAGVPVPHEPEATTHISPR